MKDYLEHGKASVLIDGQFGSTGKGLAAAYVYINKQVDAERLLCVTNAAPNAGHTTVLADGTKFVTFHMPTMGVLSPDSRIVLNAGAIIDVELLIKEVTDLNVNPARVFIHPNAAMITPDDHEAEKAASSAQTSIASTQKGVGAALANKVARRGKVAKDYHSFFKDYGFRMFENDLNVMMKQHEYAVSIETPQGMSLSLNNGFYPYCTSREVSVAQSLSDAGVNPRLLHKVLMTMRTFPIRVGNIVNEQGEMIGWSGPVYPDQVELSWSNFPGVEPERTTVTKRVRRIFTFSDEQYIESLLRLQPDYVHVGFCDYFTDRPAFEDFVNRTTAVEANLGLSIEHRYSFGPSVNDIYTLEEARRKW